MASAVERTHGRATQRTGRDPGRSVLPQYEPASGTDAHTSAPICALMLAPTFAMPTVTSASIEATRIEAIGILIGNLEAELNVSSQ